MAYQRNISSLIAQASPNKLHQRTKSNNNQFQYFDIATEDNVEEENSINYLKEKYSADANHPYYSHPASQYHHVKPLVLFSFDLTHWSPILQYIFLIGGLILFMCLYGYYQELVIYGWFNRKLSLFSTFLHFLGCTFFAQLQRNMSNPASSNPSPLTTSNSLPISSIPLNVSPWGLYYRIAAYVSSLPQRWSKITMGTATTRTAIGYYMLLVFSKTAAQGLSNLSMTEINYPAKVLFKSANPIVTIFLGVFWFRKTYPLKDYVIVALLIFGLSVFITGDSNHVPECTPLGIFYVVLSMIGSALVPMIQEHCITTYQASIEDLLYYCFLGSTIVSLFLSILNGEFLAGLSFLLHSGSFHTWFIFIAFCTFGFVGANFSTAITAHYGSLVNGLANTFRKAVTIVVSFLMFPERNTLTNRKVYGAIIFFVGLLVSIFTSSEKNKNKNKHKGGTGGGGESTPSISNENQEEGDREDVEGGFNGRREGNEDEGGKEEKTYNILLPESLAEINNSMASSSNNSNGLIQRSNQKQQQQHQALTDSFPITPSNSSSSSLNYSSSTITPAILPPANQIISPYTGGGGRTSSPLRGTGGVFFEEEKKQVSPALTSASSFKIPPPITKTEIDTFLPETLVDDSPRNVNNNNNQTITSHNSGNGSSIDWRRYPHPSPEQFRIDESSLRLSSGRASGGGGGLYESITGNLSSFYQNLNIFSNGEAERRKKELLEYAQLQQEQQHQQQRFRGGANSRGASSGYNSSSGEEGGFKKHHFTV